MVEPEFNDNHQSRILEDAAYHSKTRYGYYRPDADGHPSTNEYSHQTPYYQPSYSDKGYSQPIAHTQEDTSSDSMYNEYPGPQTPEQKPSVLEHFGIFINIPTLSVIKISSVILLMVLLILNLVVNIETSDILRNLIGYYPSAFLGEGLFGLVKLIGICLIGVFIGLLYRYFDYEMDKLKMLTTQHGKARLTNYLTIFFIVIILIFVILLVFVELIYTRGYLFVIDIMSISIMAFGTYAIFSGKRHLIILPIIIIFLIMIIGVDKGPNLPILTLLGIMTILYIEITDSGCRYQEYVLKFHQMTEHSNPNNRAQLDAYLDEMLIKFNKNLGLFMLLTIIITGLLMMFYLAYPYITPPFMSENVELQTVYAFLPIIILLFVIFLFVYLFSPHNRASPNDYKQD